MFKSVVNEKSRRLQIDLDNEESEWSSSENERLVDSLRTLNFSAPNWESVSELMQKQPQAKERHSDFFSASKCAVQFWRLQCRYDSSSIITRVHSNLEHLLKALKDKSQQYGIPKTHNYNHQITAASRSLEDPKLDTIFEDAVQFESPSESISQIYPQLIMMNEDASRKLPEPVLSGKKAVAKKSTPQTGLNEAVSFDTQKRNFNVDIFKTPLKSKDPTEQPCSSKSVCRSRQSIVNVPPPPIQCSTKSIVEKSIRDSNRKSSKPFRVDDILHSKKLALCDKEITPPVPRVRLAFSMTDSSGTTIKDLEPQGKLRSGRNRIKAPPSSQSQVTNISSEDVIKPSRIPSKKSNPLIAPSRNKGGKRSCEEPEPSSSKSNNLQIQTAAYDDINISPVPGYKINKFERPLPTQGIQIEATHKLTNISKSSQKNGIIVGSFLNVEKIISEDPRKRSRKRKSSDIPHSDEFLKKSTVYSTIPELQKRLSKNNNSINNKLGNQKIMEVGGHKTSTTLQSYKNTDDIETPFNDFPSSLVTSTKSIEIHENIPSLHLDNLEFQNEKSINTIEINHSNSNPVLFTVENSADELLHGFDVFTDFEIPKLRNVSSTDSSTKIKKSRNRSKVETIVAALPEIPSSTTTSNLMFKDHKTSEEIILENSSEPEFVPNDSVSNFKEGIAEQLNTLETPSLVLKNSSDQSESPSTLLPIPPYLLTHTNEENIQENSSLLEMSILNKSSVNYTTTIETILESESDPSSSNVAPAPSFQTAMQTAIENSSQSGKQSSTDVQNSSNSRAFLGSQKSANSSNNTNAEFKSPSVSVKPSTSTNPIAEAPNTTKESRKKNQTKSIRKTPKKSIKIPKFASRRSKRLSCINSPMLSKGKVPDNSQKDNSNSETTISPVKSPERMKSPDDNGSLGKEFKEKIKQLRTQMQLTKKCMTMGNSCMNKQISLDTLLNLFGRVIAYAGKELYSSSTIGYTDGLLKIPPKRRPIDLMFVKDKLFAGEITSMSQLQNLLSKVCFDAIMFHRCDHPVAKNAIEVAIQLYYICKEYCKTNTDILVDNSSTSFCIHMCPSHLDEDNEDNKEEPGPSNSTLPTVQSLTDVFTVPLPSNSKIKTDSKPNKRSLSPDITSFSCPKSKSSKTHR